MKNKRMVFLLLFIGIALMFGCTLKTVRKDDPRVEHARSFEQQYDPVWSATMKTILGKGYTIMSQDKNSGSISTDYLIIREAIELRAGYRYKVNVFVEKESPSKTKITITPEFQVKNTDKAAWTLWSRHVSQINLEKDLFDEIQRALPATVSSSPQAPPSPPPASTKPPEPAQTSTTPPVSPNTAPTTSATSSPPAPRAPVATQQPILRTTQVTATPDENIREKPQGKIIRKVKKGTTLTVLDEKEKWLRIRLDDGTEAWIWKASTSEASKTNPSRTSK